MATLWSSRKFWVVLVAVAAGTVLAAVGKLPVSELYPFVSGLVAVLVAAIAYEDGQAKRGAAPSASPPAAANGTPAGAPPATGSSEVGGERDPSPATADPLPMKGPAARTAPPLPRKGPAGPPSPPPAAERRAWLRWGVTWWPPLTAMLGTLIAIFAAYAYGLAACTPPPAGASLTAWQVATTVDTLACTLATEEDAGPGWIALLCPAEGGAAAGGPVRVRMPAAAYAQLAAARRADAGPGL